MGGYVMVPGIGGSDERHWQVSWEREWGAAAVRIAPASWSAPDLDDWVAAVQTAYDKAAGQGGRVVLVAHSLGCWATAAWLARNPSAQVDGAFLVAPPDSDSTAFPREEAATFVDLAAEPLPCRVLVVASTDDPYCTPEKAADLAARWGARLRLVGARGHLNSASGLGAWPQGRELLDLLGVRE
ncbi:RBBP9/YdeN family alpha/beta hydrolase [Actinomadura parmotrematis]|uniref:Alpha/beta hydrolase n=1 Tax=Actinomadura parmotrematis TaxID=2864039 RepID=A0ABS7FM02_9ACTN|nr:alpha/beta hydrolase [Actinomadura parmotrematis]MBW8481396.1 alpha/beta hydrolase [Actinomadura parmotrematis]